MTHAETTRLEIHEVVQQLLDCLGPTVVAALANSRDRRMPHRWAKANGPKPRTDAEARIRTAHQAWDLVAKSDGPDVARAWFIGVNPRLGDEQPFMALRAGRYSNVLAAARAFAEDTYT